MDHREILNQQLKQFEDGIYYKALKDYKESDLMALKRLLLDYSLAKDPEKANIKIEPIIDEVKEHLDQIPSFIETLVEMDGFKKSIVLKVQEIIFITPSNCKNKTIITVHGIDGALLSSESFENIKDKIRKALY
jgi:hypothetical protein